MTWRAARGRTRGEAAARHRRCRRAGQSGLTLVETVVAVAVLTIGVVGIAGGIAASERIAGISQNQSQLELTMRQLSDWVRNSSSLTCTGGAGGCPSLPYVNCATNTSIYNSSVANAESAGALNAAVGSGPILAVKVSTGGSRTSSSGTTQMPPLEPCAGSGTCPGATCIGDWGVQEITLRVTVGGNTVQRVVWKSNSW